GPSLAGGRSYLSRPPRRAAGQSGINPGFPGLSRCQGWVTHVLLTRSPLSPVPKDRFSLDLHVLSAPPAFVLSQDQTLREEGRPASRPVFSLRACAQSRSPKGPDEVCPLPAEAGRGLDVNARC